MYLNHFKLKKWPFALTTDIEYFCPLNGYAQALHSALDWLYNGSGVMKVVGDVGSGKTLLCRKILTVLTDEFVVVHIPFPEMTSQELRRLLARELNTLPGPFVDPEDLSSQIYARLANLQRAGKRVVILVDEAQAMPQETLETLRLLTNFEAETYQLLKIVLFAQPALDQLLKQPSLRQLNHRIHCASYLTPLHREDIERYLAHRLEIGGYTEGPLFSKKACARLFAASQGIPRLVNVFCHQALLIAYGRGESRVSDKSMRLAITDNEQVTTDDRTSLVWMIVVSILALSIALIFTHMITGKW